MTDEEIMILPTKVDLEEPDIHLGATTAVELPGPGFCGSGSVEWYSAHERPSTKERFKVSQWLPV